jgi:2'-hydroxyisoflavone reductase
MTTGGVADATKKILILGGTGFIGPHVVAATHARGHTVTLFNRGKTL